MLPRLIAWLLVLSWNAAIAMEYSGNISLELLAFPDTGQYEGQMDENLTLSLQPKFRQSWNKGDDEITAEFFYRIDSKDDGRQHGDIRELKWLHLDGNNEWRIGVDNVFWGVTETRHLVDVINQVDRVEGIDGEDKLGQPMIHYSRILDVGSFQFFVLPHFREPTFHSTEGRFRPPLIVDTSQSEYESKDGDKHIDYALRYTHFAGDTEFGLALFDGTNRDPVLKQGTNGQGEPVLIPFYQQMTQFGLDVQSIVEDWIWKLEFIHRNTKDESYNAATGGFEYTFYGLFESAIDLGTLAEYSWDSRDENAGTFDKDLFLGLRFAFNDVQSSEILTGLMTDTENGSQSFRVEGSRRLGDSWKLTGEVQIFNSIDEDDPLQAFANDSYIMLEVGRYY